MNVLIATTFLLALMISDSVSDQRVIVHDRDLASVVLLAIMPILVATILVMNSLRRRYDEDDADEIRTNGHNNEWITVISWLLASLSIVCLLPWPAIVRHHVTIQFVPIVDELLIVTPIFLSLISCWFVLFEQFAGQYDENERHQARFSFVSIRIRLYLLTTLIPLLLMLVIKDLWPILQLAPAISLIGIVLCLAAFLLFLPSILLLFWNNRPISPAEGSSLLTTFCQNQNLSIKEIRIWDTDNQIINALVTGILPRFRVLMLSDLFLSTFPLQEIKAVIKHEVGHIQLKHLPSKIGFVLLPALMLIIVEITPNDGLFRHFNQNIASFNLPFSSPLIVGCLFIIYVLFVTAWLSKNMEYEADLFAIGAFTRDSIGSQGSTDTGTNSQAMCDALLRFAALNPEHYLKPSFTHPSLADRIERLKLASQNPEYAPRFRNSFFRKQLALSIGILFATVMLLVF